jgi:propionyl-CoA carboxylase alpha chain
MIRRVLVANRGAAARRIFTTCRLIGIETVAVYSDADAGAPHVAEADWAVHLPGRAPTATYLRGDLIIAAAHKTGADAVHPGWGFLSTDPDFARTVADSGLTWVGPPAKTLMMLSDKQAAAAALAETGITVLPRFADPSAVDTFPVLVKPGRGGSRGVQLAHTAEQLAEAVAAARREAAIAYGDGTVYCEKYLTPARHLDLQVIVDTHGNAATFGEREGSVQRRHQQLVAESPSPAVTPELRERLTGMAVDAANALGYVGVATVELLLAPDGTCYLLELSPRLPAEHAVTECVAGLDLVRLQLLVAEGAPLPFTGPPPMRGHAIGIQLRAEDPALAWRPTTGPLHRFTVGPVAGQFKPLPAPGLRLDAAVSDGCAIVPHYDSTLATLVAWAPSRYEAARLLATTLARSHLHGVATNRDLLVRVLRSPTFLAGAVDTAFLDDHPEVFAPLLSSVEGGRLSCLAAALAAAAARRAAAPALRTLASGWRNVPSGAQTAVYAGPMGTVEIGYRLGRTGELESWWVRAVDPDELDLAGVRITFAVHRAGSLSYVDSVEGSVVLDEIPRYPVPVPVDDSPD